MLVQGEGEVIRLDNKDNNCSTCFTHVRTRYVFTLQAVVILVVTVLSGGPVGTGTEPKWVAIIENATKVGGGGTGSQNSQAEGTQDKVPTSSNSECVAAKAPSAHPSRLSPKPPCAVGTKAQPRPPAPARSQTGHPSSPGKHRVPGNISPFEILGAIFLSVNTWNGPTELAPPPASGPLATPPCATRRRKRGLETVAICQTECPQPYPPHRRVTTEELTPWGCQLTTDRLHRRFGNEKLY